MKMGEIVDHYFNELHLNAKTSTTHRTLFIGSKGSAKLIWNFNVAVRIVNCIGLGQWLTKNFPNRFAGRLPFSKLPGPPNTCYWVYQQVDDLCLGLEVRLGNVSALNHCTTLLSNAFHSFLNPFYVSQLLTETLDCEVPYSLDR